MSNEYTPGPWTVNGSEETTAIWVSGPDGKRICTIRNSENDLSNARLIAASRDLLAVLNQVRISLEYCLRTEAVLDMDSTLRDVRAALAKARGDEPYTGTA